MPPWSNLVRQGPDMVQVRDLKAPERRGVVRCGASKRLVEGEAEGRQMSVPGGVVRVKCVVSTVVVVGVEEWEEKWVKVWEGIVVFGGGRCCWVGVWRCGDVLVALHLE